MGSKKKSQDIARRIRKQKENSKKGKGGTEIYMGEKGDKEKNFKKPTGRKRM